MKTVLKLQEELSMKDVKKFKIPNILELEDFNGSQYAMIIGAITKNQFNKTIYKTEYSKQLIIDKIPVNQFISFCERYKNNIIKRKTFDNGFFVTIYYILYCYQERPLLINGFNYFKRNKVTIEITFNENGFYRIQDLHLELSPNTSIISAIHSLFSSENIDGLPFIIKDNDNHYYIKYYDDFGREKVYKYESILSIYNCITNIRLIECEEIFE